MALTQGLLSKLVADAAPDQLRGTAFGLFNLASGVPDVDTPPPQLGQDTEAILKGIGRSTQDIEGLRQRGVV